MTTARELAEKIFDISYSMYLERSNQMKATLEIESLLSAALAEVETKSWKEAKADAWIQWQKDVKEARAEAFEEAIQSLAGMVENDYLDVPWENVEAAIRRRAGEGK